MTPHTPPARRRPPRRRRALPLGAAAAPVAVVGLLGLVGATSAAFRDRVELPVEGLDGTFAISQPATGADCSATVPAGTPEEAHLVLDRAASANIRRVPVPLTGMPTRAPATFPVTVCHDAAVTGDLTLTLQDRTPEASPFASLVFAVVADGEVLTGPVPLDGAALNALNDGRGVVLPAADGARTAEVRIWMLRSAPTEHALRPVDIGVTVAGRSVAGAPVVLEGVLP
ncbi:hypothetical protein [Cellulomonas pakistanensis]|uniref:Uncharacterized protein n=1 Tax=Cellulomonas pakistanensis TaxID=992287 RepID=A0A919U729_9CELL|nr:hypothetical protein [Cellulomonas pakistanensis]GIG36582.1 hypothetical protein Cpa01nite_19630 [Cellulomonas pakistanensis]